MNADPTKNEGGHEGQDDFREKLRAFVGRSMGPARPGPHPVNEPMIDHWCDAIGDRNPAYVDAVFAEASSRGSVIAPPTMLHAWVMRGLAPTAPSAGDAPSTHLSLFGLLDGAGFTSVVATDCEQEYVRELRPGDRVSAEITIESISDEKRTALGAGHFVTQLYTFRDQRDDVVGTMRFRMLKFRPPEAKPRPAPAPEGSGRRPRPGINHDNRFFWDGVREGRLLIQRCTSCSRLRHPPGPMCPACHSLEWNALEASGRGEVYSFVLHYHPTIPPFPSGHPVALVALAEGTRLVADLVGIEADAVRIGMPVQVEFNAVDDELVLPQFRPLEDPS